MCIFFHAHAFINEGITSHPQTAIGYAGQRLMYSCESYCGEKFWRLNGSFADGEMEYPYRAVIDDSRISTLSVEASAATNNSVVTCWLFNPPNNEESNVTIIVQGKHAVIQLASIINLTFISRNSCRTNYHTFQLR